MLRVAGVNTPCPFDTISKRRAKIRRFFFAFETAGEFFASPKRFEFPPRFRRIKLKECFP
jgi:hypothetical protein